MPSATSDGTATEIEGRCSETLSAQPLKNIDFGSPCFSADLSNPPRIVDESYDEKCGDRREQDITSDLGNQQIDINDATDPLNLTSPIAALKVESVQPPARSTSDFEQQESHKHEQDGNSPRLNISEFQSNGANQDEIIESALRGLEKIIFAPPPRKDEQEERVEQRAGISDQVNGDDPASQTNGSLNDKALVQQPDMDHRKILATETGKKNERRPEAEASQVDNEVPPTNGSATPPLLTQNLGLPSPREQIEKHIERKEDPQSQRSYAEITSQASGSGTSHRLSQALVVNLPIKSTARPLNDDENILDTENSHLQAPANGHVIPQLLTEGPELAFPDSAVLEKQNENSSSLDTAPVEVRGITALPIHAPIVESSGQKPSAPKRQKKRAKFGVKFCSCFGEADGDQHELANLNLSNGKGNLPTAPNQAAATEFASIPPPSKPPPNVPSPDGRPPNVPAPMHAPPPPPVLASTAHLAREGGPASNNPSAPSSLYDAQSARAATASQQIPYARRLAIFSAWSATAQSGSETDRDSMVILKEDKKVEELLEAAFNPHTNLYIAQFQEDDPAYKTWDDLKKRQELTTFIKAKISKPDTHDLNKRLWYWDYLKVSKNKNGPWESMVLIGCDKEEDHKKLSNELEKEAQSDSWFLKDYMCRAEIGRDVTLCAVGSTATPGQSNLELLGTPIYGEDTTNAPTLCGQLCHIKGPNELSGSLCTMGGVLHINQDFYVLTSAHPFRQETSNLDRPDTSSKEKIGLLSSFKLDNPTTTAGAPIGLASDWALISLDDQYIKPNVIKLEGTEKLIPITGYLPMADLTAGKVWVCTNRGPQLGALVQSTTIMGMGQNVFETRGIRLEEELKDGDSGSWVVRNGKLCGFIIGRTIGEPRAYMLPIERVFQEIREHLEATLKDVVSSQDTWLGGAATNETADITSSEEEVPDPGTPHKKRMKKLSLVDIKGGDAEEQNRIRLAEQEKRRKERRARLVEKGYAVDETRGNVSIKSSPHSTSQPFPAASPIIADRPINLGETKPSSSSPSFSFSFATLPPRAQDMPDPPQPSHIPETPAADDSNIGDLPTPPPSVPTNFRLFDRRRSSDTTTWDEILAAEPGQAAVPEVKKLEVSEGPIHGQALSKGEMSTKPVAKQDEKQKSPEKHPSNEESQEPSHTPKQRDSDGVFRTHHFPVPPVEDDMEIEYLLRRLDIFNLEREMTRVLPLFRRHIVGRGSQISQSIVTEVVIFNDLMCQVLHVVPSTDPGGRWWIGIRWLDLLLSKVGRTKAELILSLVAEEVQLIRLVNQNENGLDGLQRIISRGRLSSVFHSSRIFVWDPIISKLAVNNQRLKSLVESHQKMVSELSGKNSDIGYDCTPQLELYKALQLHFKPPPNGVSVGLVLPRSWISGKPAITEKQEVATLDLSSGSSTNSSVKMARCWLIEPARIDMRPTGAVPNIFDSSEIFNAPIERIDGSRQLMELNPISRMQSMSILSFNEFMRSGKPSREASLRIALYLSVGMIFLSPTPWYNSDSTGLWEKAFILYGSISSAHENILFVPSPNATQDSPQLGGSVKASTSVKRSILGELGLALIEIALRRKLSDHEINKQIASSELSRSGIIALEMGVGYQDIVNICFTHKYESNYRVVEIDESSAAFRAHANEAIIVPLRALWREAERSSKSREERVTEVEREKPMAS